MKEILPVRIGHLIANSIAKSFYEQGFRIHNRKKHLLCLIGILAIFCIIGWLCFLIEHFVM